MQISPRNGSSPVEMLYCVGGVISPLLANIYLHEVLDKWFAQQVVPRLRGRAFVVRYADDFIIGLTNEDDARRVMDVLPHRFGKYGLAIHPEKTQLVYFQPVRGGGSRAPGTFDFLGFTHYWGLSRKGLPVIRRKTASGRFGRGIRRIAEWCRAHRHDPVETQHTQLTRKLKGHYAYYGITGNYAALGRFCREVEKLWHKWLARRSQRGMSWERFKVLLQRFTLPPPRVVHSVLRTAKP